jgi:hypothetical protein
MSYIILRGRWCHIIVLNAHVPTEDKIDHAKDSFYEESEHVFDKIPKYHIEILLGDFSAEVGREDVFKPTVGNESLHEGGWRGLQNEELRDLYSSPSIIRTITSRRTKLAGNVARMERTGTRIGYW